MQQYISIFFIYPDQKQIKVIAKVNNNLLQEAHKHGVKIKANCGGVCACTTCHCFIEEEYFENISEIYPISDKELDKLETLVSMEFNSRLVCQMQVTKNMHNIKIYIDDISFGEHH